METTSINTIKDLVVNIQTNLDAYRNYLKNNSIDIDAYNYGTEKEYNIKGIIAEIKNVLTDISYLTRSHNLFIKLSTYSERNEIKNRLNNLNTDIQRHQNAYIVSELEWMKSHLRTYNLSIDRGRFIDFNSSIDELSRKAVDLENGIQSVKNKLAEANSTYEDIQTKQSEYTSIISELTEQKDSFIEDYNTFVNEVSDFRQLAERAKVNEQAISTNLEETNKEKEIFDEFIEKIDNREKVLEKQNNATNDYEQKLSEYNKDHKAKLDEVGSLIKKAREALQYTTAAGMSAAFQEQYNRANGAWTKWWWLFFAVIFMVVSLGIGAWIVTGWGIKGDSTTQLYSLIGRLSMVPLTIYASFFCANQFVKQKNLAEDYAYKVVLTKSIVAFSEELRGKDNYSEYISTVLKEIHQDPLRKRGKDENGLKEVNDLLGKASNLIQALSPKA